MAETFSNVEVKVKGFLKTALSAEASTATIDVEFVKEDDTSESVTIQSDTLMFEIDPLNKTGKESELILATSNTADTPVTGTTRLSTVVRGLSREGHEQTGSATRANSWDEGTEVAIATGTMAKMMNLMAKEHVLIYPSNGVCIALPVYADDTARDAAITSPSNGYWIYNTAEGVDQKYVAGTWENGSNASTTNASATVAGKVELATQTEADAGTDTGDSGASLAVTPSVIAEAVQDQSWSFGADAEASDTYVITLTPAPDAYATGQRYCFTANTANTGAATLNVNALGAKTIKKLHDQDLETGDIESGQVVEVVYDGTNMQMVSRECVDYATEAYVTANTNAAADDDTFSPTQVSDTKVIAHGLGRAPKCVLINWVSTVNVSQYNTASYGSVVWNGSSDGHAGRYPSGTGTQTGTGGVFNVSDNNSATISWTGALTADATNITISLSNFNDTCAIGFTWIAF